MVAKKQKAKPIYAVYRGDKFFFDGTAEEVAGALGIKVASVRKLATPSQQARSEKGTTIVKLGAENESV
ncbi:hypothetical protein A6046_05115 [[Haemophilus] ducreyi]|uniref:Uncharacterized protein n=2 Tax=Haemophilus ducreyi TaxID=730 RepID=Q7VNM1_HAEDU|nr:hypothetical protein [[Haemophilus] ducreyi]AAP95438.1 hypothetical protein HD_0486 [[Haemophilus] ducreyi 35000HP]AKO30544.1 hypothetical protein RY60_01910 [[Haemophilus] ducreyi]AKO31980.1 hypothetical protein RZ57_01915 [[Haemophilus] ducreyi]AKO33435.1 hypothetical protein RZ58_01915 [[Haemophilus] ducreyi]AKO34882.1 hypothetical protein RZ59_01900 [[Haemophilus] ducreyi]